MATTSPFPLPLDVDDSSFELDGGATVRRTVLPNGVRVLTENMPGAHSVTLGIWVPVGSRDEHEGQFGSTHFLEHLLFKGTPTRTAMDIAVAFDEIGGESNALTGKEHTCYYAKVRDADLGVAVDVLTDMVISSVIDPDEFERECKVILEELAMSEDDPTDVAHELFSSLVYRGESLGRPIGGTPESINAVGRDAVWAHYRANYRPEDIVVTAAGAIDHGDLLARLGEALAAGGMGASTHGALHPRRTRGALPALVEPSFEVRQRDAEQVNLIMGTRGIPGWDERRFTLSVLNGVLGGGMSSRLFQEVREQRGLAYSVYSFSGTYADAGSFGVYAGTRPDSAPEVAHLMQDVVARFAEEGPTATELARVKGQLSGGITLGFEDSSHHMTRLGKSEIGLGELWDLPATIARIRDVTAEQVRDLAAELVAGPLQIAAVGPIDADRLRVSELQSTVSAAQAH
ncbi:MAG: M16 family metallopeptidase [Pseudoclavibacter sp.]